MLQAAPIRGPAGTKPIVAMASRSSFGMSNASERTRQAPIPLQTSKLANQLENPNRDGSFKHKEVGDVMDTLLKKLQDSETSHVVARTGSPDLTFYRDFQVANRSSSSGSVPVTPAGKIGAGRLTSSPSEDSSAASAADVAQLKLLLATQQQQIATMQQELDQTRQVTSTMQHTVDGSSEPRSGEYDIDNDTMTKFQGMMNNSTHSVTSGLHNEWRVPSTTAIGAPSVHAWTLSQAHSTTHPERFTSQPFPSAMESGLRGGSHPGRQVGQFNFNSTIPKFATTPAGPQMQHGTGPLRIDSPLAAGTYAGIGQASPLMSKEHTPIPSQPPTRPPSAIDPRFVAYGGYPGHLSPSRSLPGLSPPATPMPFPPVNNGMHALHNLGAQPHPYMLRPIGTRPSPSGGEFQGSMNGPWNTQVATEISDPTYIPLMEPLNYRRLLERDASCNWDYIVEKIICNNDQQASIFLQQKLKQAAPDHKFQIIQAIIQKCYPLMINRFGNFLVQRCFEHGTQDQVIAIANAIRGNTLSLSMDAFGCHVVQKAFDVVPEEYKAMMVHELLRNIPQTVIHRYACHVWQKLFELRWSDSPPQIMKYVNEALSGMWHSVALGETGSLVVQNIFENCLEEDKRPCIDECLASIDEISRGQFGNWCIQHICEHGAAKDRVWAVDHILRSAQDYSMDQYASKVVEKCLKIGGDEFMDRYLDRVCEARPDRPRQAIIDIAGDQYGNYLIQWILANASTQHREIVSAHVRKHMVSLRGSKYGSRVAMLCSNPQSATRPGAPAGFQLNRYNGAGTATGNLPNPTGVINTGRPPHTAPYR